MKIKQVKADIVKMEAALTLYHQSNGDYPLAVGCNDAFGNVLTDCIPRSTLDDYARFETSRESGTSFVDPWFQPYRYQVTGSINNSSFADIASAGPDRDYGTDWQNDSGYYDVANVEVADNINNWTEK